jgi:uncharacterized membrane protein
MSDDLVRGLLIGVPISLTLWMLIIFAVIIWVSD